MRLRSLKGATAAANTDRFILSLPLERRTKLANRCLSSFSLNFVRSCHHA